MYIHINIYRCINIYIHIHIYTYIYIYKHTHTKATLGSVPCACVFVSTLYYKPSMNIHSVTCSSLFCSACRFKEDSRHRASLWPHSSFRRSCSALRFSSAASASANFRFRSINGSGPPSFSLAAVN